jgi:hypothetical protein
MDIIIPTTVVLMTGLFTIFAGNAKHPESNNDQTNVRFVKFPGEKTHG